MPGTEDTPEARLIRLEKIMANPGFWDNQFVASRISGEHARLLDIIRRMNERRHA